VGKHIQKSTVLKPGPKIFFLLSFIDKMNISFEGIPSNIFQDEKNQIMQTHVYVLHVSMSKVILKKIICTYLGMARLQFCMVTKRFWWSGIYTDTE